MTRVGIRAGVAAAALAAAVLAIVAPNAGPAASAEPGGPIEGTVLVVAPHPDDDVIIAAGVTYNRPNTVIAYMTNGESHSRDEIGTITAVNGTTQFTDSSADFSDIPIGTKIDITSATPPGATVQVAVASRVNATTITITPGITGLAVGDTYATFEFVPVGIPETRQAEAVAAQAILGRSENDLRFLGYPDFYLTEAWGTHEPSWVWGEGALHHATFASRGPGGTDWHDYRTGSVGEHANYNHENMLDDMVALIDDVRPAHVFTTGPEDGTADHRTTYAVVKAAMEVVAAEDPSYGALLHSTVVWQNPPDPLLNQLWPNPYTACGGPPIPHTAPPDAATRASLGFTGSFAPAWEDRQTYEVPAAMQVDRCAQFNPKWEAIQAHESQAGDGAYISNFMHSDEFFWAEAIPAAAAIDDGPYVVKQGKTININGVLDNDVGYGNTAELVSGPSHASSFTLNPDGTFTYQHDGTTSPSDSFTYRANDAGGGSSVATVAISITLDGPPPPPPPPPPGSVDSVGLVDPSSGLWRLYDRNGVQKTQFYFGTPGDYPIYGDWNCDGIETPGLYRQSDGYVYLRNANTQGVADIKFFFGNPGDVPLAGDFNNDGCDTVSIYRPSNQTFYIINKLGSNNGGLGAAQFSYVFGNPGDKPFVGDFDGNGTETVGLHRESTGLVYFRNSHTQGVADAQFIFGDPGDRLVAGDWNGNGGYSPALFRPSNTTMYFRFTNTQGNADAQWMAGSSGWLPIAGYNGLG